jgi:ubiquitin C-terminal hydrolase
MSDVSGYANANSPVNSANSPDNSANSPAEKGVIGIMNMGNTCYMNSAIQALRSYPEFTIMCTHGFLEKECADKTTDPYKIVVGLSELVQSLLSGSRPHVVRPSGFLDAVRAVVAGTIYEDFVRRVPQDAHEYVVWLLDQLYMASARPAPITAAADNAAAQAWKTAFEKSWSPLASLFFGLLRISYSCSACSAVHHRFETFNVLKITPREDMSWTDCIREELTQEETIEGYACETCEKEGRPRADARRTMSVWKLPKLLILTVKRYGSFGERINTPVIYDNSDLKFTELYAKESAHPSKDKWYKTFATVDHLGRGMGGGHYVAQAWSFFWKRWFMYDDDIVQGLEGPAYGRNTYMIFMRVQEH